MATLSDMSEILDRYTFYHVIDLGNGVVTPGVREFMSLQAPVLEEIRRADLRGKRVLDIGCRDGLFSFEAERRGGRVHAIDHDLSPAAVEFLIPWFKSSVEMRQLNVYDLQVAAEDRFDFVIFSGVLYHLRMPFLGLKRIADATKPGGTLLLETALMLNHHHHPFVYVPPPQESPYEPTSISFFNHRALVAALESMGFENVECRAIISPSAGHPRYQSWDAILIGGDPAPKQSGAVSIGRATYLCRRALTKARDKQEWLDNYWYRTPERSRNIRDINENRRRYGFTSLSDSIAQAFGSVGKKDDPPERS
jgi:SAM-dependent methyltransferase